VSNNAKYINALEIGGSYYEMEALSVVDRFNEAVMIGLRTIYGVDMAKLKLDFGLKFYDYLLKNSKSFIDNGTLYLVDNCLKATNKGKFLVDGIAAELFYV
jgi:oxygen-independent coproporphyrinogen-3 oxidase